MGSELWFLKPTRPEGTARKWLTSVLKCPPPHREVMCCSHRALGFQGTKLSGAWPISVPITMLQPSCASATAACSTHAGSGGSSNPARPNTNPKAGGASGSLFSCLCSAQTPEILIHNFTLGNHSPQAVCTLSAPRRCQEHLEELSWSCQPGGLLGLALPAAPVWCGAVSCPGTAPRAAPARAGLQSWKPPPESLQTLPEDPGCLQILFLVKETCFAFYF